MVTGSEGAQSANSSLILPFVNDYLGPLDNMEMRYFFNKGSFFVKGISH
jgi:hypothetical protein